MVRLSSEKFTEMYDHVNLLLLALETARQSEEPQS